MRDTYERKAPQYFSNPRMEIAPLLPTYCRRTLEIGCGAGATLNWIKSSGRCEKTYGIELSEEPASRAREHSELVLTGNAEVLIDKAFEGLHFDLVLCLDVLEHMVDPWAFMKKLTRLLASDATVVFSIPNVRNLSVILPLILSGEWRYRDEGILDSTHLRFFTREGALQIASTPPLVVDRWMYQAPAKKSKLGLLHRLTLGLLDDFCAHQILIASRVRQMT